ISRLPEGVIALYWRCPHLGCTVPWVDAQGLFICPCHGSVYEPTGQNIAGPAPRPMDYMRVEIRGGRLVVDTGDIRERDRHRPDHVTPVEGGLEGVPRIRRGRALVGLHDLFLDPCHHVFCAEVDGP